MILHLNNLNIFLENPRLYYIFKDALYIIYEITLIINVIKNINLFHKLI